MERLCRDTQGVDHIVRLTLQTLRKWYVVTSLEITLGAICHTTVKICDISNVPRPGCNRNI